MPERIGEGASSREEMAEKTAEAEERRRGGAEPAREIESGQRGIFFFLFLFFLAGICGRRQNVRTFWAFLDYVQV